MKITLFYTLLSHSISKHIIVCDIYNNTSYLVIMLEGYDHITRNNVIYVYVIFVPHVPIYWSERINKVES